MNRKAFDKRLQNAESLMDLIAQGKRERASDLRVALIRIAIEVLAASSSDELVAIFRRKTIELKWPSRGDLVNKKPTHTMNYVGLVHLIELGEHEVTFHPCTYDGLCLSIVRRQHRRIWDACTTPLEPRNPQ